MIYEQVSQYVKDKGIKQSFICNKTGIEKNALSNILSGDRRMTADEFLLICNALDEPMERFTDST